MRHVISVRKIVTPSKSICEENSKAEIPSGLINHFDQILSPKSPNLITSDKLMLLMFEGCEDGTGESGLYAYFQITSMLLKPKMISSSNR